MTEYTGMTEYISASELLTKLKKGDIKAFDLLYSRYAEPFYRYARNRGLTHEEAQDAGQSTFLRILNHIDTYDESKGGSERWVWQIHRNTVADQLKPSKPVPLPVPLPEAVSRGTEPTGQLEEELLWRCLTIAWNRISNEDRDIIRRRGKRGPVSKAWREAMERLKTAFRDCYGDTEST